jgi:hypothetical protein
MINDSNFSLPSILQWSSTAGTGCDVFHITAVGDWLAWEKQIGNILVRSLITTENWTMNHYIFAMRTYSETRSTVQMQRNFWHEPDIPRHGIPSCNGILKWVHDFNVRGSVVNKSDGPAHPSCTPEKVVDNDDRVSDVLILSGEVHLHKQT